MQGKLTEQHLARLTRRARKLRYSFGSNYKRQEPGLYWLGWKQHDGTTCFSTGYTLAEIESILATDHGDISTDLLHVHGISVVRDGVEVEYVGGGVHTRLVAMPLDIGPN